jgi:hypothetical protein
MDNALKGTNVGFNKNTEQKRIKINSGYFWVPPCFHVRPQEALNLFVAEELY